jgi:uncharacterized GH25 family protein
MISGIKSTGKKNPNLLPDDVDHFTAYTFGKNQAKVCHRPITNEWNNRYAAHVPEIKPKSPPE